MVTTNMYICKRTRRFPGKCKGVSDWQHISHQLSGSGQKVPHILKESPIAHKQISIDDQYEDLLHILHICIVNHFLLVFPHHSGYYDEEH